MVHRPHSKASELSKDLQTRLRSQRRMACQLACSGAILYAERIFSRQPYHTSILTGHMWVHELLHGNPRHIQINLGWRSIYFSSCLGSSSHSLKLATLIMWILM